MDDSSFPRQYLLGGKKQGYYNGEVIVSHLTYPYTFNVIMEDSSVTPVVDTALIEFRILERFTDAYINEALLVITDLETSTEVYNATVTGGRQSVRLNQSEVGYAYPHYKVEIYADGYVDFTDYILQVFNDGIMPCRLTSIVTPLEPGNTLMHFWVQHETVGGTVLPVNNAKITCNNETKYTNSAGYSVFEVPKNNTFLYSVEHSLYQPVAGSRVVYEGEEFVGVWMHVRGVDPTPTPTVVIPGVDDPRTPQEQAQAALDFWGSNLLPLAQLAFLVVLVSMCFWLVPGRR